ncbi:MAG: hypothetical protein Ct9H300mP20_19220 [Gammaproteobacteria bacterium]|nr:MAG: hypothetical protein Ct9H300mP20_19220 [Gammaproteobacteria bacterium]
MGTFPIITLILQNPENLTDLISLVKEKELEVGLAFDGDADRLGVVSKEGKSYFLTCR